MIPGKSWGNEDSISPVLKLSFIPGRPFFRDPGHPLPPLLNFLSRKVQTWRYHVMTYLLVRLCEYMTVYQLFHWICFDSSGQMESCPSKRISTNKTCFCWIKLLPPSLEPQKINVYVHIVMSSLFLVFGGHPWQIQIWVGGTSKARNWKSVLHGHPEIHRHICVKWRSGRSQHSAAGRGRLGSGPGNGYYNAFFLGKHTQVWFTETILNILRTERFSPWTELPWVYCFRVSGCNGSIQGRITWGKWP